jgi:hypothetical protein
MSEQVLIPVKELCRRPRPLGRPTPNYANPTKSNEDFSGTKSGTKTGRLERESSETLITHGVEK